LHECCQRGEASWHSGLEPQAGCAWFTGPFKEYIRIARKRTSAGAAARASLDAITGGPHDDREHEGQQERTFTERLADAVREEFPEYMLTSMSLRVTLQVSDGTSHSVYVATHEG